MSKGGNWKGSTVSPLTEAVILELSDCYINEAARGRVHLVKGQVYLANFGFIPIMLPSDVVIEHLRTTPDDLVKFEQQKARERAAKKGLK